ncbi:MAG: tetraacyldisaccharide 4'-kinase [Deltaproteobacteria bacterium]|nr:tetraacyldisaccharide 4'-kinase [Deltaproteobacteria bacterium]
MRGELIQRTPIRLLLSKLYGGVTTLRNYGYDRHLLETYQPRIPVLSVGNLTVGGTGKSPFVQFLAQFLLNSGRRPVILSRGYGGLQRGPRLVSAEDDPREVGDETVMHAQRFGERVPVVIARERARGAMLVEERGWGDVIVLDDGFQHRALARSCDLIVVDTSGRSLDDALRGDLLPAGPFREQPAAGLRRAHGIIALTRPGVEAQTGALPDLDLPVFGFQLRISDIRDIRSGTTLRPAQQPRVRLLAAIGNPGQFQRSVESMGFSVETSLFLPDHAPISCAEWDQFFRRSETPVIVTAKDAVKVRPYVREPNQAFVALLEGELDSPGDHDRFAAFLNDHLVDGVRGS